MAAALFLIPFFGALAAAASGIFRAGVPRKVALAALAAQTSVAAAALARCASGETLHAVMGGWSAPLGIEWNLGLPAAVVVLLVSGLSFLALLGARDSSTEEHRGVEGPFHACALLLVAGLVGMLETADLFNFFVHLELSSLAAYALAGQGGSGAPRAALRYLVMGSFGASFYLLGVGHLYAATGTLGIVDVSRRLAEGADPTLTGLGALFIIVGLSVKMGLFPLHAWMPDAYARCSGRAAALMAPLVTKVAAFSLLRITFEVFGPAFIRNQPLLSNVLMGVGTIGAVMGALRASREQELRRIFAWSSVSQAGYVAIAVGLASRHALLGAFLVVVAGAAAKAVLFSAALMYSRRFGVTRLEELGRVRGAAPWTVVAVTIAALSLFGLPPLPGFFGKWLLLQAALEQGRPEVAAGLLAAALAAAVYVFRLLERLYFGPDPEGETRREGPWGSILAALGLAAVVVGLGLACGRLTETLCRAGLPGGL